jgi:hypothetical protein
VFGTENQIFSHNFRQPQRRGRIGGNHRVGPGGKFLFSARHHGQHILDHFQIIGPEGTAKHGFGRVEQRKVIAVGTGNGFGYIVNHKGTALKIYMVALVVDFNVFN